MKCKKCNGLLVDLRCETCQLIATHWNDKTGEVYSMIDIGKYLESLEEMQNQLDDAFDHQYFDEM